MSAPCAEKGGGVFGWLTNYKLHGTRKEAAWPDRGIIQAFTVGSEKYHENISQDNLCREKKKLETWLFRIHFHNFTLFIPCIFLHSLLRPTRAPHSLRMYFYLVHDLVGVMTLPITSRLHQPAWSHPSDTLSFRTDSISTISGLNTPSEKSGYSIQDIVIANHQLYCVSQTSGGRKQWAGIIMKWLETISSYDS